MPIESLFPEELSEFRSQFGEGAYVLVDVRQPEEYRQGHIPGARLLPLPELEQNLEELRSKPNLVFYCRSGARSQVAANLARASLPDQTRIANLVGGFTAWEGKPLADMPRWEVFAEPRDTTQVLLRAMDLEKAAQRFYQTAAALAGLPETTSLLETLAEVEQTHAKVLFHRLQKLDPEYSKVSFEDCFSGLAGDILEGGRPLEDVLADIHRERDDFLLTITELALEIELMAYDLYKNLAGTHAGTELEPVFLDLSRDELNHQRLLMRLLPAGNS